MANLKPLYFQFPIEKHAKSRKYKKSNWPHLRIIQFSCNFAENPLVKSRFSPLSPGLNFGKVQGGILEPWDGKLDMTASLPKMRKKILRITAKMQLPPDLQTEAQPYQEGGKSRLEEGYTHLIFSR